MQPTDSFPHADSTPSSPYATGGDTAENAAGTGARTGVRAAATKARRAVSEATSQGREKLAEAAGEQKDAAAEKIAGYGSRLREAAESARDEDPNIAHFANRAADQLESAANYVREADFDRIKQDAASVARRHPALFMGGMLVAGLVLGNIAKASVQSLREDTEDDTSGFDDAYGDGTDFPEDSHADDAFDAAAPRERDGTDSDSEFGAPSENRQL